MQCLRSHPWAAAAVFAAVTFFLGFRLGRDAAPSAPGQGYYIHKSDSAFYREALKTGTDKVRCALGRRRARGACRWRLLKAPRPCSAGDGPLLRGRVHEVL